MSLGLGTWKTLTEISETNTDSISNSNAVSFTESARIKAELLHITCTAIHITQQFLCTMRDFRLPQRSRWELCSSGLL